MLPRIFGRNVEDFESAEVQGMKMLCELAGRLRPVSCLLDSLKVKSDCCENAEAIHAKQSRLVEIMIVDEHNRAWASVCCFLKYSGSFGDIMEDILAWNTPWNVHLECGVGTLVTPHYHMSIPMIL